MVHQCETQTALSRFTVNSPMPQHMLMNTTSKNWLKRTNCFAQFLSNLHSKYMNGYTQTAGIRLSSSEDWVRANLVQWGTWRMSSTRIRKSLSKFGLMWINRTMKPMGLLMQTLFCRHWSQPQQGGNIDEALSMSSETGAMRTFTRFLELCLLNTKYYLIYFIWDATERTTPSMLRRSRAWRF